MLNAVNWFEIPASDIERATRFYSTIFGVEIAAGDAMPGFKMAQFPTTGGVGGAILQGEGYVPSTEGTSVYLNGGEDLGTVLDKVEKAGGKVIVPKTSIGENGFFAFFMDTEGNKVGLHSMG